MRQNSIADTVTRIRVIHCVNAIVAPQSDTDSYGMRLKATTVGGKHRISEMPEIGNVERQYGFKRIEIDPQRARRLARSLSEIDLQSELEIRKDGDPG